jgi:spore germination protein YaaH/flagellar hook assembly protein FlgD
MHRQPRRRPTHARRLAVALGFLVLAGSLPLVSASAASPKGGAGLQPTIHYEEALAHAKDKLSFAPGGRVTVPFRPRKTDTWKVGGAAPRALPAGRASGRAMRTLDAVDGTAADAPLAVDAAWHPTTDASDVELTAAVDPGALKREVFGFLPYWELSDSSTRLDWEKISTVAFFGVGVAADGSLQKRNSDGSTTVGWSGWTSAKMTSVINAAHTSGARVVLTVQSFAWSSSGATRQKALLGSSTARANLAKQIATAVRDRGADGVNLDFEPIASGYADEFTSLVRKVRSTLDATAKGYQLTFDTTGWIGNYPIGDATAPGGADAIMVMGYDYRTSGASVAGSIAPIHSSIYDISDTLSAYLARVPASKLILGVPYYGRAWSTVDDTLHSDNRSGTKYGASSTATYGTARGLLDDHGRRYDPTEAVAWTAYKRENCTSTYGCVTGWRQLYVDDATALKSKYDLVNKLGLRGVGIWALGYDGTRTELYSALKAKFITDSVPPTISASSLSADVISPNGDDRFETITASLTASALVKWGYRVQPLSGTTVGTSVRSGSVTGRTPSFTWNGRDKEGAVVPDGAYRLTLWAADASDNRSEKAWTVTVDTRRPAVTPTAEDFNFSPDGNGYDDHLSIAWTSSQAIHGTVRMIDASGASRRLWRYDDRRTWSAEWDGRDDAGARLPNGTYRYRVNGRDRAGNLRIVDTKVLLDDTVKLHRWSDTSFDPRAGQTSRLTVELRRSATVTATIHLGTTKVRTIWSGKALAAGSHGWTWNGKTSSGSYAKAGKYRIVVAAKSRYGTTHVTRYVTVQVH